MASRCPLRVILYQGSQQYPPPNVRFSPFATDFALRRNMSRRAEADMLHALLPVQSLLFFKTSNAWSMLKLAGRWLGGNSLKVSTSRPTSAVAPMKMKGCDITQS